MTQLSELELYDLPMGTPEFAADPYSFVEEARKVHPWIARCENGYCVFEYTAIRDLMWMDDKMRPSFDEVVKIMGAKGSPWGRFTDEQMIALPEREHRLLRDTFAAKFTPRFANQMRPAMQQTMNRLLDEWAPRQRIDFEEFASYYPVSVLSQLVGGPVEAIPGLRQSLEAFGLGMSLNPNLLPELDAAYLHLEAFCEALIDDRKANPGRNTQPDLLDVLIEASDDGGISRRQLTDLLVFLYAAGYDTSKNVITYLMHTLMEQPVVYRRCAEDIDYCRLVVEEMFRFYNPGTSFRFTDADITYRDVELGRNTMLFFPLSIVGRDPTIFDEPHKFDPERKIDPNFRQLAFGLGKHMCLGQYIARAQIQEGIHLIAQRMLEPRRTAVSGIRPFYGIWGYKGLPIEFTDAKVTA
ncbi:MAG: cytochrome P450 [Novosphingobium sp.]